MCDDGLDRSGLPITDNDAVRNVAAELYRSARLARWFGLGLVFVGVLAMIGSAAATVWMGDQVRTLLDDAVEQAQRRTDEQERGAVLLGDIMTCILGQFAEHREASRADHQDIARFFGEPPLTHGGTPGPPQYDHDAVTKACDATTRTLNSGQKDPLDPLKPPGVKPGG
jgi:hypothetical protein